MCLEVYEDNLALIMGLGTLGSESGVGWFMVSNKLHYKYQNIFQYLVL